MPKYLITIPFKSHYEATIEAEDYQTAKEEAYCQAITPNEEQKKQLTDNLRYDEYNEWSGEEIEEEMLTCSFCNKDFEKESESCFIKGDDVYCEMCADKAHVGSEIEN